MASTKTRTASESGAPDNDVMGPRTETTQQPSYEITIYDAWCKKCGICAEFCPKGVLTSDQLGTPHPRFPEKCIGCTQCVLHCPDFAITVSVKEPAGREPEEQQQ